MELSWLILLALVLIGASTFALRRTSLLSSIAGILSGIKFNAVAFKWLTLATIVLLLALLTPIGAGLWKAGVSLSNWTGCNLQHLSGSDLTDSCKQYTTKKERLRASNNLQKRQTEINQAIHRGNVELARKQASALQPVPDNQVIEGIVHLGGVESGLYDFLIGKPTVLNAKAITLKPGQFADLALDPNRPTPRCSRVYPKRGGLEYEDRRGPDRIINNSNAEWTIVAYEFAQGTDDPFGNRC